MCLSGVSPLCVTLVLSLMRRTGWRCSYSYLKLGTKHLVNTEGVFFQLYGKNEIQVSHRELVAGEISFFGKDLILQMLNPHNNERCNALFFFFSSPLSFRLYQLQQLLNLIFDFSFDWS